MPKVAINGIEMNYEEVGSGEPMVYLAYTIDDAAKDWVDHMKEHASGYRVIIPDPRGLAGSTRLETMEPSEWVTDLVAFMDALSLPSALLVAETLGTRVAVRFAAEYPDRVKALVLNAVIAGSAPGGDEWRRKRFDPSSINEETKKGVQHYQGDNWAEAIEFYLRLHERNDFKTYYDLPALAGKVKAPTLIMRGDIDEPVHSIAHAQVMHKGIANSWLAILPNTSFNVLTQKPKEAWALINRFIGEVAG
jgi:pimeloyl-ACP methyl ester carboxylesterase